MDSSSGSESGETLKLISHDVGGISPRDVELETTSIGSNGESLPRNYDGYAMQYEMDLFEKSQYSATTSSYSSSEKYSEDYFQVLPTDMTKIDKDVLDFLENSNAATIAMSSSSTEPASMVSDITHESLMHGLSPARSPPQVQLMDRLGGYQPRRIPASVFERSPSSTPAEWSIASNDSLFSIHIGNISFTRDQFVLSEDLRKSVEFPHFDEAVSTIQAQEYDDGPIAELEKNFQDNENATRMSISVEEKRDDPFATSTMPSVNDKQHGNLSRHPIVLPLRLAELPLSMSNSRLEVQLPNLQSVLLRLELLLKGMLFLLLQFDEVGHRVEIPLFLLYLLWMLRTFFLV
ncbi:hypothetical protein MLD38_024351 [Melastoma candidum]|uniref:Uncharacterized protein n=1 Tax=Melastoma candidum TaxID=119954 RepID=A0ACB9NS13_9MYRT|nr:hypothetical protein MLD38_024351 [Melastoma candidum]